MYFYLVRHGEAKGELEDPLRPLSVEGKQSVERVATFLSKLGIRPEEINCSEKLRAIETAEIIATGLSIFDKVKTIEGLAPNDAVDPIADLLCSEEKSLMLVGHLPFLSRLLSLLVISDPERPVVSFQPGTVVCLTRDDSLKFPSPGNGWIVKWVLSPGDLY
ncbi:MAG TPA: phosphohistidine phosphatase SixA [Thermodesulfobacteriota bacterium]